VTVAVALRSIIQRVSPSFTRISRHTGNDSLCFIMHAQASERRLDIAPIEPPCTTDGVPDALWAGDVLTRLSGLRVLQVGDSFFIHSERHDTLNVQAMDVLCRETEVGQEMPGETLQNPALLTELTGLIYLGYRFFDIE
jgi:ribosomal protein L16 Arg81 hydroxylase